MKSYLHSLIPFLLLFCSYQFRRLDLTPFQTHIPASWRPEIRLFALRLLFSTLLYCRTLLITNLHGPRRKHNLYRWRDLFTALLPSNIRHIVARVLFAECFFSSRCLAMGMHVTIYFPTAVTPTTCVEITSECTINSGAHSNYRIMNCKQVLQWA
jgi:hypothetical protein